MIIAGTIRQTALSGPPTLASVQRLRGNRVCGAPNAVNRMIGRIAFAVLVVCHSLGVVQAQDAGTPAGASWDTCLRAPVRACILDEALMLALPVDGNVRRAALLESVAEAWAKAGDVDQAMRVVKLIPDGHVLSVWILRAIAEAQAKAGRRKDAGETIEQALQRAYSLKDRLQQAQWLHSIARTQMESGATAEAAVTFDQALQSAQSIRIDARPGSLAFFPARSLDGLLKDMTTEQADAGQIAEALPTARSINYDLKARAEALSAIAAVQSKAGLITEAAATLEEALQVVREVRAPPQQWSTYRATAMAQFSWERNYVEMLCDIAKAQARAGLLEKAAATFDEAFRAAPTIRDPAHTTEGTTPVALAHIAESQHEVGLTSAAITTLDRAIEAARALKGNWVVLAKVGGAQAKVGLATAAAGTFDRAIELARAVGPQYDRAAALADIAKIQAEAGLMAEAAGAFDEAFELARMVADKWQPGHLLLAIAGAQRKAGLLERAEATFAEAVSSALSSQHRLKSRSSSILSRQDFWNTNALYSIFWGPHADTTARLVGASAALRPQVVEVFHHRSGRLYCATHA
jgi:tetratricopeptide (TPR) repeat protein